MFGLGATELMILAVIILLFFGARRLPEIGGNLGKAISEFRKVKKYADVEGDAGKGKDQTAKGDDLETAVKDKIMDSVPVVRQARNLKDKADKIKSLVS